MENEIGEFLAKLFAALGMSAATDADKIKALKVLMLPHDPPAAWDDEETYSTEQVIEIISMHHRHRLIDRAVVAKQLHPHEREWALNLIADNGLAVFNAFVAKRGKIITPLITRLKETRRGNVQLDKIQAEMNQKLMISEKLFLKYNGAPEPVEGIDDLQASINRQLNVSPEVFKKYNQA